MFLLDWHRSTKAGVFGLRCLHPDFTGKHKHSSPFDDFNYSFSMKAELLGSSWTRAKLCCLFMWPQSLIPLILQTTWQSLINHSFLCADASGCSEFTYGQTYSISSFRHWAPVNVCVCVHKETQCFCLTRCNLSYSINPWAVLEILHLICCFQSKTTGLLKIACKSLIMLYVTKPGLSVNFSKLRFMHHLKAE